MSHSTDSMHAKSGQSVILNALVSVGIGEYSFTSAPLVTRSQILVAWSSHATDNISMKSLHAHRYLLPQTNCPFLPESHFLSVNYIFWFADFVTLHYIATDYVMCCNFHSGLNLLLLRHLHAKTYVTVKWTRWWITFINSRSRLINWFFLISTLLSFTNWTFPTFYFTIFCHLFSIFLFISFTIYFLLLIY